MSGTPVGVIYSAESGFLALSSVGALFHFDNVGIFQDFKPVAARGQEDNVSRS
jgi:hypothetical protein